MMNMMNVDRDLTRFMMQFCYNCDDAMQCATEEACKACFINKFEQPLEEEELLVGGNQYSF